MNDDNEDNESLFFPLYYMILNYWFPPAERYYVCPMWTIPLIPGSSVSDDFSITYVIMHHRRPFLLVEVKPPSDFLSISGRNLAINQIMRRLDTIGPNNHYADRLYAISAIGKRWRACYASMGHGSAGGQPVKGIAARNSLRSAHPDCWNADITSDASWEALGRIVATIKQYGAVADAVAAEPVAAAGAVAAEPGAAADADAAESEAAQ